jgi:ferredoxin
MLVPRWTRRPRQERWAPSVVDPRLCTGCNQCPQDCPWDAITMVERDDDRPTLVARVDPARCVSCGICAGSCAPMGIGPAGRTGRDQLAAARTTMDSHPPMNGSKQVVAICCAQLPASHVAALRERGAFIHPVTCVGNLHTSVVELFARSGAPGVVIAACPPRDCTSREGPKWLGERLFNDREAELQARVDRRRIRVITFAPGDLGAALAGYDAFTGSLSLLDVPEAEAGMELEEECEPVPLEVEDA